jgi:hypothetical protein
VVNVTDGADVQVRLCSFKFPCHIRLNFQFSYEYEHPEPVEWVPYRKKSFVYLIN